MSNSQAAYSKYYTNSAQFEPIVRDVQLDKVREVSADMIPSKTINKYNVKDFLNKEEKKSFRSTYLFRDPSKIYEEIISDCRGALVSNIQIMTKVNTFYSDKFETNLNALYEYSPKFFRKTLYKEIVDNNGQTKLVPDQANFSLYEKYIYLSCMIYYINHNKEKIRGEVDVDADAIINWAQIRNNDALLFFIEGPRSNYDNPINFIEQYHMLVSSANSITALTTQNQLAKMDLTYSELTNFKKEVNDRPNSYHKEIDSARQYFVVIRDEQALVAQIDSLNNLVFDASHIDIGDITNQNTNGNYNSIIVEQNKYSNPPSQITYRSLQQLFNRYNAITIQELSFNYGVYKSDLSKYTTIYLVFPGINTIEHTIYGTLPRGMLMIAGKFVDNKDRRRYEFIPNEPLLTFDGSQTNVTSFQFYITTNYKEMNSIEPNNMIIDFNTSDVFNHLISTKRSMVDVDKQLQLRVPSTSIYYDIPLDLSTVLESDIGTLITFVNGLDFVPSYISKYFNNLKSVYDRCVQLKASIIKKIVGVQIDEITVEQARDAGIEDELNEYNKLINLYSEFASLLKTMNMMHKWQEANIINMDIPELMQQLANLSTNEEWKSTMSNSARGLDDYESVRYLLSILCSLDISVVIDVTGAYQYEDYIEYANVLDSATKLILNSLNFVTVPRTLNIDIWNGFIDGLLFHYDTTKDQLHFVYSENDADTQYHYLKDSENNVALMRFFDENCKYINGSTYLYNKTLQVIEDEKSGHKVIEGVVQRSYMNIESPKEIIPVNIYKTGTVIKIHRTADSRGYNALAGCDVDLDMEATALTTITTANDCYANITEFMGSYQEADFWYENDELRMKFVKYIDDKLLPLGGLDIDLFVSEHDRQWSQDRSHYFDTYRIYIDSMRQLHIIRNRHVDVDADPNDSNSYATSYDETYDLLMNLGYAFNEEGLTVTTLGNRVTIEYKHTDDVLFEYFFDMEKGKVNVITVSKFKNHVNRNEAPMYLNISLYPKYYTSTPRNYVDVATKYIDFDNEFLTINKVAGYYIDDNAFRAYYTTNNLISDFWLNDGYLTSILINPIIDVPKSKAYCGSVSHITGPLTIIYTVEDHKKSFYNLLVINKYGNDWLMLVDDQLFNASEVYVYENDLREYRPINVSSVVTSDTYEISMVDENDHHITLTLSIDHVHKTIYNVNINNAEANTALDIVGNIETGNNYCFQSSRLDSSFQSLGTLGINFEFSNTLVNNGYPVTITMAYLTLSTSRLYKYTIENNRPYRSVMYNYYYNINTIPKALTTDGLISIRNTNALSYNRILPYFKYYQNCIESKLYANDKFKMVVNKDEELINNTLVRLRKHKMVTTMNENDLEMATSIPHTSKHLIENIDKKIVINSINNYDKNELIAITTESGIIDSTDNNAVYLSMNIK